MLVCVFSFNVVDAIILLLYVTDVFANLLIISFTTNFLFQKLLQSGKTNKPVVYDYIISFTGQQ